MRFLLALNVVVLVLNAVVLVLNEVVLDTLLDRTRETLPPSRSTGTGETPEYE